MLKIDERWPVNQGAVLRRVFNTNNGPFPTGTFDFHYVGEVTIISGCDAQLQFGVTPSVRWAVTLQAGAGGGCAFGGGPGAVRLHYEDAGGMHIVAASPIDNKPVGGQPFRSTHKLTLENMRHAWPCLVVVLFPACPVRLLDPPSANGVQLEGGASCGTGFAQILAFTPRRKATPERMTDEHNPVDQVPPHLGAAITHLQRQFENHHWSHGEITCDSCYAALHPERARHSSLLRQRLSGVKRWAGSFAAAKFDNTEKIGTPDEIFEAHFALFGDALLASVRYTFDELFRIARVHSQQLGRSPVEWAILEQRKAIESTRFTVKRWLVLACDPNPIFMEPDSDLAWNRWRAPLLVAPLSLRPNWMERIGGGVPYTALCRKSESVKKMSLLRAHVH